MKINKDNYNNVIEFVEKYNDLSIIHKDYYKLTLGPIIYNYIDKLFKKHNNKQIVFSVLQALINVIDEKINNELDFNMLIKTICSNLLPKEVVEYFIDLDDQINDNNQIENENNEELMDLNNDIVVYNSDFKWRGNQIDALNNMKIQKYMSGVVQQIMGAGKSALILGGIQQHYNFFKDKQSTYMIACYRKEILNKMFFTIDKNGEYILDENKKKFWKDSNIIDLDQFEFVEYVNEKSWINFKPNGKPKLIVINTTYLDNRFMEDIHDNDDTKYLKLVMLDECHCISAPKTYKTLKWVKFENKTSIIGFSATPLRDKSGKKLCEIFSKTCNVQDSYILNLISVYDYIDALTEDIVLPFKYYYIEVKKDKKNQIGKTNKDICYNILSQVMKELPYCKIIAWTKSIAEMTLWYDEFKLRYPKLKIYKTCHTDVDDSDLNKFYDAKRDAILICVNRCREGSDIENVDCGIYLDAVMKRSILVSMQSGGRIIRPDKDKKKTRGIIIDMFVTDENKTVDMMTIDKLLDYYKRIINLNQDKDEKEQIEKLYNLLDTTIVDKEKQEITIKIDNNASHDTVIKVDLINKEIDWDCIRTQIKKLIDDEIKKTFDLTEIERLEKEYRYHVEKNISLNIKTKQGYKELSEKCGLLDEPEKYFNSIWKNWYHYLNIDVTKYSKTKEDLQKILNDNCIRNTGEYYKYAQKLNLPLMPEELYCNFTNFDSLFSTKQKLFMRKN